MCAHGQGIIIMHPESPTEGASPNKDNYLEKFIVRNLSSSASAACVGGKFDWMSAGGSEGGAGREGK